MSLNVSHIQSLANEINAGNSSATPLGIGAVFTGSAVDVSGFSNITINVTSDVASAANGLSVQFSSDGTNWDITDEYTINAGAGKVFTFGVYGKYLRIVYTNGGSAQTYFRLQTILMLFQMKPSSHPIAEEIDDQTDAEMVKSILTGKTTGPAPIYRNVLVDDNGSLNVVLQERTSPPGTTPVVRTASGSVTTFLDDIYTITSGNNLIIQNLKSGCEASVAGSKVTLYEDPNGDLSVLNFIWGQYLSGTNSQSDLSKELSGDGTRRIVMRRQRLDGGAKEILAEWNGYEYTP